ncbi:MAG: SgcJ/EcaC family oxidoreductase [Pseudomonadota bacterium]
MSVVNEITSLFEEWNSALQTGDPKKVAALYADNGILLPTVSNKVRHNHAEIGDYFVHFLAKGPAGKIDEANIRVFGQIAINSGVYTFTFKDGAVVTARYTFVYRWNGQRWMIIEHHSSQMPE